MDWFTPIVFGLLVAAAVYFAWSTFEASQNAQKRDFPAKARTTSAWRPIGKLGRNTAFALICVLISACWIVWPYYAAYDLATALRDGDSIALENRVAWDSVRQSLRADLNAILLRDVGSNNVAAVLGPAIINQMIEGYITPQGVANLMRSGTASTSVRSGASEQARQLDLSRLKYAFFSGNPLTFKVEIENVNKSYGNPFIWIMKWNGTWKLTRLVLPAGTFPDHINARPAGSARNSPPAPQRGSPAPIKVALLEKGFKNSNPQNSDFEDDITFSLSFENLTDKDIRAFDGTLTFTDLLDNVVHSSKLAINEMVRTGSTLSWDGQIRYNQFIDTRQRLRKAALENLKINFAPRRLLLPMAALKIMQIKGEAKLPTSRPPINSDPPCNATSCLQ